jgi:hypothetical protein
MEPSLILDDHGSCEDALHKLKETMTNVNVLFQISLDHFKTFHQKVAPPIDEALLQVKPEAHAWFIKRNLDISISFVDFFRIFLAEHKDEYRLDLSRRSILLNKDAADLLGSSEDTCITLLEILRQLPTIFY